MRSDDPNFQLLKPRRRLRSQSQDSKARSIAAFKKRIAVVLAKEARCPACASLRKRYAGTLIVPVCIPCRDRREEAVFGR